MSNFITGLCNFGADDNWRHYAVSGIYFQPEIQPEKPTNQPSWEEFERLKKKSQFDGFDWNKNMNDAYERDQI